MNLIILLRGGKYIHKNKKANNIMEKYPLFYDKDELLKYREQIVADSNYHSSELVQTVKYYTSLISALFSFQISIMIASFTVLYDKFFLNNSYLYIIFVGIPILIFILSDVGSKNIKRLYRNTQEHLSIKMKIDEILGVHEPTLYFDLRNRRQLKLFGGDISFANSRWEDEYSSWYSISSGEFINYLIEREFAGQWLFSRFFVYSKYITYFIFVLTFLFIIHPYIIHLLGV